MLWCSSSLNTPTTLLSSTTSIPWSTPESGKGSSTSAVASLPRRKVEELVKHGAMKYIWLGELSSFSRELFVLVSFLCKVMIFSLLSSSFLHRSMVGTGMMGEYFPYHEGLTQTRLRDSAQYNHLPHQPALVTQLHHSGPQAHLQHLHGVRQQFVPYNDHALVTHHVQLLLNLDLYLLVAGDDPDGPSHHHTL